VYPANLFSLFPPFPRENNVFVAMSFDKKFDFRWNEVISPAIKNIKIGDDSLNPIRVDDRLISDSILSEILQGISNSRLVFVDITAIGVIDDKAIRNGNVMYELGVAQSIRLAEEVIMFRSDSEELLFDTSSIRVNKYDPGNDISSAIEKVEVAMRSALSEIDLRKNLAINKSIDVLDEPSYFLLIEIMNEAIAHSIINSISTSAANAQRVRSIDKLLELGAIKTNYLFVTPQMFTEDSVEMDGSLIKYQVTEFGSAMLKTCWGRIGFENPELLSLLEQRRLENEGL